MPIAPTHIRLLGPGGAIDPHRHDDHQIVYASRGVLAVTTSAGSWITPSNRAIWIPAGTAHGHRAYGELELHTVGIPATENALGSSAPTIVTVSPLLRELIKSLTSTPETPSPERARLRSVVVDQVRVATEVTNHLPAPTEPLLTAVAEIFTANPAENRTLHELGREVGASSRTLSRMFHHDLGMTFPQWRTQLRLHRALIELAAGSPVSAVAHRLGWASTSAFIDVFRHTYGVTPGRYE